MGRFAGIASAVFACLGGCGKTQTFTDASPGTDGHGVDGAAVGTVTVTTHSRCCTEPNGTLEPGIAVFAIGPDGSAGPTGTTGADGVATLTGVVDGSGVTAIYPVTGGFVAVTTLGVSPGDHLVYGDEYQSPVTGANGTMTVTFPSVANATSYYAYSPCGEIGVNDPAITSLTIQQSSTCQTPTANVLLYAYDVNFTLVGAGELKNIPYTDGSTAALAAWTTPTANNLTMSLGSLESTVTDVEFQSWPVVDGVSDYFSSGATGTIASGTATAMFTTPTVGERLFAVADAYRSAQLGSHETTTFGAADATTVAMTAPTMPWLGGHLFNGAVSSATWAQTAGGSYDGAVAWLDWNKVDGNGNNVSYAWNVIIPPGLTQFSWGGVPAAVAPYLPADTDTVTGGVFLVDLAGGDGYDYLRSAPEWQVTCPACVARSGELAGTSTVANVFDGGEGGPAKHRH